MTEKYWSLIKDNIISLTTVGVGIVALVLQGLGSISTQAVANTTLLLVALLATSEIVERHRRLSKLEKMISSNQSALADGIDELMIKKMSADDIAEYIRYLMFSAKDSVRWASPEPRRASPAETRRVYEEAVDHLALSGKVRLTWISTLEGKARNERARRLLFEYKDNPKIHVGYIGKGIDDFPFFSFLIFDEKTLVTRAPYTKGGRAKYLVIRNPSIVELFLSYFERLLLQARKLEATEEDRRFLDTIGSA